jgi:hypothetical protein
MKTLKFLKLFQNIIILNFLKSDEIFESFEIFEPFSKYYHFEFFEI